MTPRQQPSNTAARPKVVLTTIPSDAHTWNLLFLQLLLEEHGCSVTNAGACVPAGDLVAEAAQVRPDLIVVSTVNGLGVHEGPVLARAVRAEPRLRQTPLVIGGKIDTLGTSGEQHFPALLAAGFDRVLVGERAVPELLDLIGRLPMGAPASAGTAPQLREYAGAQS